MRSSFRWHGGPAGLIAAVLIAGVASHAALAQAVSEQLVVGGAVKSALTLKVDDLKAFPADRIVSVPVVARRVGDDKALPSVLRGVQLTVLLERAGAPDGDHDEWKHTVVTATATDGYQVAFSWPELFNTEVGASVIVAFERDGQPLADREGRIALCSARDLKAGPRSVKWLARLNVSVLKE